MAAKVIGAANVLAGSNGRKKDIIIVAGKMLLTQLSRVQDAQRQA